MKQNTSGVTRDTPTYYINIEIENFAINCEKPQFDNLIQLLETGNQYKIFQQSFI